MKISTEIDSTAYFVGEHKAIELIAKAGFDAWDFSMFGMCKWDREEKNLLKSDHILASSSYLSFARELRKVGEDNGIVCNQSHAPFPSHSPEVRPFLKRAIECTAEAGGEICIIHPGCFSTPEENAEMYFDLLDFAKDYGVKIATENMWDWNPKTDHSCFAACATSESFNAHLDAVNDENFVACLDLGHADMEGSGSGSVEMIKALGPRLKALHIHDNDLWHDSHQIPFSMNMDFEAIVKALKEINYDGYFTLEANAYARTFAKENIFDAVVDLKNAARKLADMFEKE